VEWLAEYGLFLAKAVTVLVAVFLILTMIASLKDRNKRNEGYLSVVRLNEQFGRLAERLGQSVLDKASFKVMHKARKLADKNRAKARSRLRNQPLSQPSSQSGRQPKRSATTTRITATRASSPASP
jgi:hypothetical protein